jgi:hypothetical protein
MLVLCHAARVSRTICMRQRGHFHSQEVPGSARSRSASFTQREFHAARAQLRALHSAPLHREPHEFQGSASFISRSASCTQRGHSCTRESCRLCTAAPQFNSHSHRRAQKTCAHAEGGSEAAPGHVGGERVCRTARAFEFAFESGGPCPPAVLRVCDLCCQRCMPHDLAPPVSAAVPAAASAAVPAAASTACAHTPTREVALVALVALEGSGGLGGSPARCRRVGDEMATRWRDALPVLAVASARRWQQHAGFGGRVRGVRGAWPVARGVARAGFLGGPIIRRGAGLKMKTRVAARLLVAPRGATC